MTESHKATLDDLIQAIAENMTQGEIARTIVAIKVQDYVWKIKWKIKKFAKRRKRNGRIH